MDLFAGCGGLTLGVAQAARRYGGANLVTLAVESDAVAADVYQSNFPKASVHLGTVEELFDGALGAELTSVEQNVVSKHARIHVLVGGPPCQGHSNLNNHTRGDDPKNILYLRMVRAAEVLRPSVVLIENVPAVRRDRSNVVHVAHTRLLELGYRVGEAVVQLDRMGVPQRRKRHVLLAAAPDWPLPSEVFTGLARQPALDRDLRWAIGDLVAIANPTMLDQAPRASAANLARMAYLLENDLYDLPNYLRPACHQDDHSYKSMYGRLRWNSQAQTITSGFTSIGQGRYMHPDQMRALTPHEAARIQGFPDYFDFTAATNRGALSTMIGNAAPPQLGDTIVGTVLGHATLGMVQVGC